MTIGLSTYAFLWRSSDRVENPLTLHDILRVDGRASGCTLLQICDFAPLDDLSIDGLNGTAARRRGPRDPTRARHPRHQPGSSAPLPGDGRPAWT